MIDMDMVCLEQRASAVASESPAGQSALIHSQCKAAHSVIRVHSGG